MTGLIVADANQLLATIPARWVQALGLRVEALGAMTAQLRLPFAEDLVHAGGVLCGQTMMAAADTAMVVVLSHALGGFQPMTTVTQTIQFLRPVARGDLILLARINRLGKNMAFGTIDFTAEGDEQVAAQATTVFALLGHREKR